MFVHVPSRRKPRPAIAAYFLVALSIAMFVAWWGQSPEARTRWLHLLGVLPGDWVAIASQGSKVFVLHVVRLATALFVHADGLHLIGNLVFLLVFGASAEKPLGAPRLIARRIPPFGALTSRAAASASPPSCEGFAKRTRRENGAGFAIVLESDVKLQGLLHALRETR